MQFEYPCFEIKRNLTVEEFYTIFELDIEDKYVFVGEMHDFWELMFVEKGTISVCADDRVYELKENDLIIHKPMELHKFSIENGAIAFIMSFSLNGKYAELFKNCTVKLSSKQRSYMYEIIKHLKQLVTEVDDGGTWYLSRIRDDDVSMHEIGILTERFLLSLVKSNTPILDLPSNYETEIFKQTVHIIDDNLSTWITTADIAEKLNISVSYLKKVFSKYAGLGVHKYFLKAKMTYACRLLQRGMSISEVAEALSFSSYNYFSIVFKRETGKTPSQFKHDK